MARAKAASGKALQALNGGNISDVIRVRGARQHNLKALIWPCPATSWWSSPG